MICCCGTNSPHKWYIFSLPLHLYFIQHLTEIIDHHWNHSCSTSASFHFEPTVTGLVHSSLLFWLISRPASQAEQFSAMLLRKNSKKLIGCVVQRDDMLFLKIVSYKSQSTVLQISRKADEKNSLINMSLKTKKLNVWKRILLWTASRNFCFMNPSAFQGAFVIKSREKYRYFWNPCVWDV